MKLLLWLVLGLVVLYVLRKKARAARKAAEEQQHQQRPTAARPAGASQIEAEAMVCCAQCGVYLPESEALRNPAEKVFCSEEHRIQYSKR